MAEYTEVIKQFKRMCKSVTLMKCTRGECPIAMGCENIGQCRKAAFERPLDFEKRVMDWAAEHPEPVYPTWEEWLQSIGVMESSTRLKELCQRQLLIDGIPAYAVPTVKVLKPIPADIAQKLGIEPKEE